MMKAGCYFDYLNYLLSITPEGAGTLVLASVVPSAPSHFFSFSNLFAFYVGWGKGWGERKVIMYKGTPVKCFFSVLT